MNRRARQHWVPIRSVIPNAEHAISERYNLPCDAELFDLLNRLREFATRDLPEGWTDQVFKKQRGEASKSAKAIAAEADELRSGIKRLQEEISRFELNFNYNPALMESIFNADFGPPDRLYMPEEIEAIGRVFRDPGPWATIDARLQTIINLPIRKPSPGRISHTVLSKALEACRSYWKSRHRTWKPDMLDVLQPGDSFEVLEGECERFVADILGAVGFEVRIEHLARAWPAS